MACDSDVSVHEAWQGMWCPRPSGEETGALGTRHFPKNVQHVVPRIRLELGTSDTKMFILLTSKNTRLPTYAKAYERPIVDLFVFILLNIQYINNFYFFIYITYIYISTNKYFPKHMYHHKQVFPAKNLHAHVLCHHGLGVGSLLSRFP